MPDQTVVFSNFGFFCNSDGSGTISGIESDIRIGTLNQPKMCLRMQVEEAAKEVGFSYFFFIFWQLPKHPKLRYLVPNPSLLYTLLYNMTL